MHVLAGCFHFQRPCLSKFLLCAFHARLPVMVMKRGGCGLSHGHMGMELFLYALPPYCHMPFVILQIRAGAEIVKLWFVCVVEEHATVCDVLSEFSAGTLDGEQPLPHEFRTAYVQATLGKTKSKQVRVSSQCPVSNAVSTLGQYMEFSVLETQETPSAATSSTMRSSFTLLMASENATSLPPKWDSVQNKRMLLKKPHHPHP